MISPLPAMFTGHLISPIESTDFIPLIRPAIFPPIGLPVFAAIFLPYIACMPHTSIISTTSATVPT